MVIIVECNEDKKPVVATAFTITRPKELEIQVRVFHAIVVAVNGNLLPTFQVSVALSMLTTTMYHDFN